MEFPFIGCNFMLGTMFIRVETVETHQRYKSNVKFLGLKGLAQKFEFFSKFF